MTKTAFCLLSRTLNINAIHFLEDLQKNSNIDVYMICDDNNIDIPDTSITIIRYRNDVLERAGYINCTEITTHIPILAWDKALYHYCEIDTSYDYIFLVEDDVFIPSIQSIIDIDNKYTEDLLCQVNNGFLEVDGGDIQKWLWKHIYGILPLPWYASMVCAVRVSNKLLQEVRKVIHNLDTIPFIETLFNTIATQSNLSICVIPEFKEIRFNTSDVDYTNHIEYLKTGNWLHPIKKVDSHPRIRELLKTV